jgi:hypothetical protein
MLIYYSYEFLNAIVALSCIFIFFIYYNRRKNKFIFSSIIETIHPDIFINNIINAFYYANMHGKKIQICLFLEQISPMFDQSITLKSVFNTQLIKFLMSCQYSHFIFFITKEGILEIIYFDHNAIIYNENNRNILITIDHSEETNLFHITQDKIVIKNNNAQKTMYIIKEILKQHIV